MNWLTEPLAKWVLILVGALMVALVTIRATAPRKDRTAAWLIDHLQLFLSVLVVVFLLIRPFVFQAFFIPSGSMEPTLRWQPIEDRLIVNKAIYQLSDPHRGDIVVFRAPPEAAVDEKEFIKRTIGLPGETVEVVPPRLLIDRKCALVLSSDEGLTGIPASVNPPEIAAAGDQAVLRPEFGAADVRVIARPEAVVRFDPQQVIVDGKVELDDAPGRIQLGETLRGYGGDPGVRGTVYTVEGQPRLVVLAGKSLQYEAGHVLINGQPLAEPYVAEPPRYAYPARTLGPRQYFMMGDNRNNSKDSHAWGPLDRNRVIGRAEVLFWPVHRLHVIHWWLLTALAVAFTAFHFLQRLFTRRQGPGF